jgi:hypothetical protein
MIDVLSTHTAAFLADRLSACTLTEYIRQSKNATPGPRHPQRPRRYRLRVGLRLYLWRGRTAQSPLRLRADPAQRARPADELVDGDGSISSGIRELRDNKAGPAPWSALPDEQGAPSRGRFILRISIWERGTLRGYPNQPAVTYGSSSLPSGSGSTRHSAADARRSFLHRNAMPAHPHPGDRHQGPTTVPAQGRSCRPFWSRRTRRAPTELRLDRDTTGPGHLGRLQERALIGWMDNLQTCEADAGGLPGDSEALRKERNQLAMVDGTFRNWLIGDSQDRSGLLYCRK